MSPARATSTSPSSVPRAATAATSTSRSSTRARSCSSCTGSTSRTTTGRSPNPDAPLGNGLLLWFELADLDGAAERARGYGAEVIRDVHVNPNAKHRELWFRDPDGYTVVLAGPSEYRPR